MNLTILVFAWSQIKRTVYYKHTCSIINNQIHDYNEKGEIELIPVHRIPASLNPLINMEGLF